MQCKPPSEWARGSEPASVQLFHVNIRNIKTRGRNKERKPRKTKNRKRKQRESERKFSKQFFLSLHFLHFLVFLCDSAASCRRFSHQNLHVHLIFSFSENLAKNILRFLAQNYGVLFPNKTESFYQRPWGYFLMVNLTYRIRFSRIRFVVK